MSLPSPLLLTEKVALKGSFPHAGNFWYTGTMQTSLWTD